MDQGDYVVVVNCKYLQVSGRKMTRKIYYSHTGYPGGLQSKTYQQIFREDPCDVLRRAVWGMLPRNETRKTRMERLKLFPGEEHPFEQDLYRQYAPKFEGDTNFIRLPDNIYK